MAFPARPRLRGLAWRYALFLLATLIWAGDVAGGDRAEARLVVAADRWCPYNCEPGSERPGYLVDVLREVFAPLGVTVRYRVMPWKRALYETERGRIDAALGAVAGDRGNNIIGREPLGVNETVLVVRRAQGLEYRRPQDLSGLTIGVVADYSYDSEGPLDRYLAKRAATEDGIYVVRRQQPLASLLAMLTSNRIDVFPENRYVVVHALAELGYDDDVKLLETGVGDSVYIAFTPDERGRQRLKLLDQGVRALRADGRLRAIMARYGIFQDP